MCVEVLGFTVEGKKSKVSELNSLLIVKLNFMVEGLGFRLYTLYGFGFSVYPSPQDPNLEPRCARGPHGANVSPTWDPGVAAET